MWEDKRKEEGGRGEKRKEGEGREEEGGGKLEREADKDREITTLYSYECKGGQRKPHTIM